MSGINRFLSRRDKRSSGSPLKNVKSPSSSSPMPEVKSSLLISSSSLSGTSTPSSFQSWSSITSISLAFQNPNGKCSPHSHVSEDYAQTTTADSVDLVLQPRLVTGDDPYGLFPIDEGKKPGKDEEKKIKALQARLSRIGSTKIKEPHIGFALRVKYSDGDQEKAYDFLVLLEDSMEGIIREYSLGVKLVGAVNREKVTCWLDALLFAMFARLGSFEPILYRSFDDQPRKRLALLLRLWVNMLRTGKLITTDITKLLQEALAGCGWEDAANIHQHDVSEAFTFITEQLELPRLTLKMDIYHTGKEDAADDHKLINERLLQVGIPSEPTDGKVITLEDCLENYFNNRIEVRRHLERKGTISSMRSLDSMKGQLIHVESVESRSPPASPSVQLPNPLVTGLGSPSHTGFRTRSPSIIRDRVFTSENDITQFHQNGYTESRQGSQRQNSMRKEVLMPAWQFFSLMPWHTDQAPANDAQVAAHFSAERPVLGLCLKRYSMLPNGRAIRLNTYIDIPLEIGFPHFIRDNEAEAEGPQLRNFKLSLQSVVCHRGVSVDSGHYIALVRSKLPNIPDRDGYISPSCLPDAIQEHGEDRWMIFDDLARERVAYVDIEKALKEESPYLLFYQVQPLEEPVPRIHAEPPPPYSEMTGGDGDMVKVTTASEVSTSSAGNRDQSQRTSFDLPALRNSQNRVSTSSERPRSSAFNEVNLDGPNGSKDSGSQSSDASRQGLGAGAEGRKHSSRGDIDEGRLSSTFSRLAARISRDRLRTTEVRPGSEESPVVAAEQPTGDATTGYLKAQLKRPRRRGKSKAREDADGTEPLSDDRNPERECTLM